MPAFWLAVIIDPSPTEKSPSMLLLQASPLLFPVGPAEFETGSAIDVNIEPAPVAEFTPVKAQEIKVAVTIVKTKIIFFIKSPSVNYRKDRILQESLK